MAHMSVALPTGVVVQVFGAEGNGSVMVATVEHVSTILPPLWPRCVGAHYSTLLFRLLGNASSQ